MAAARADAGVGGLGALLPRSSFLGPKGLGATARVPSPQRRRENAFRQNVPGAGAGAGAGAPSPSPLLPGRQRGVVAPRAIASSSLPAYRKRTHGRSGIGVTEVQEPPRPSSPESALPPLLPRPVVPSPYEKEAPLVKEARKLETVLEFSLAPDDASLAEQLLLVKSIQRSTGLCRSAVGEPVACPQDPTGVHPKQPCFQLVPRTIRAPASSLSPESYSLLTGVPPFGPPPWHPVGSACKDRPLPPLCTSALGPIITFTCKALCWWVGSWCLWGTEEERSSTDKEQMTWCDILTRA